MAGCGSDDDDDSGADSTGGSSGSDDGGTGGGHSGGSGASESGGAGGEEEPTLPSECADPFPSATADYPVIDDFDDDVDGPIPDDDDRSGAWYSFANGDLEDGGAEQMPDPGTHGYIEAEADAGDEGDGDNAMHTWGGPYSDLTGIKVVFSEYEPGAACPYDASAYDGITFKIRGTPSTIRVSIGMPETTPVSEGGLCTGGDANCWNFHWVDVELDEDAEAWTTVEIPWGDLDERTYGPQVDFDASRITEIDWEVAESQEFDFYIDDLAFLGDGTAGQGGAGGAGGAAGGGGASQAGAAGTSNAGQGGQATAGQGGAPNAGQGGEATAGQGGASAGQGGASAGQGGASAGQGGTSAGQGGASAGTAGG